MQGASSGGYSKQFKGEGKIKARLQHLQGKSLFAPATSKNNHPRFKGT